MTKYLLLAGLLFIYGCKNGRFDNSKWVEYNSKDSIPQVLKLTLDNIYKSEYKDKNEFEIADPDESFNATDVVLNKTLPRRQLAYLAKNGTVWRFTYKHGGIGLHFHFIECSIEENRLGYLTIGVSVEDLKTRRDIEKAISQRKIYFNPSTDSI